jgi:hypothetical protein
MVMSLMILLKSRASRWIPTPKLHSLMVCCSILLLFSLLSLTHTHSLSVCFVDSYGLHRAKNCDPEQNAISLHLYTPPYVECRFKKDPDVSCCDGVVPIVNCAQDYVRESEELNLVSSLKSRPLYANFRQVRCLLFGLLLLNSLVVKCETHCLYVLAGRVASS